MRLTRKKKQQIKRLRKSVIVLSVLVLGLVIVNIGGTLNLFESMSATEEDYYELADKLETYIMAEYERQMELNNGEVKLASIVKDAKRLNNLGLTITYNDGYYKSVAISLDLDTKIKLIKIFDLN